MHLEKYFQLSRIMLPMSASYFSTVRFLMLYIEDKNSSGDEIANVNFLRRYRTRTSKYQKREHTSCNKLDDS